MGKHGQGKSRSRSQKSKQNNTRTDMSSEKKELLSSTSSSRKKMKKDESYDLDSLPRMNDLNDPDSFIIYDPHDVPCVPYVPVSQQQKADRKLRRRQRTKNKENQERATKKRQRQEETQQREDQLVSPHHSPIYVDSEGDIADSEGDSDYVEEPSPAFQDLKDWRGFKPDMMETAMEVSITLHITYLYIV